MARFIEAVLILSGMIIGVGMFGIPFSFARSGFLLGTLELVFLTGLMALVHLLYARIILATPAPHRIPGYARLHIGEKTEILAVCAALFGIAGSLLAYILVGSIFLHNIFELFWAGSTEFFWAVAIAASSAFITIFNLKKEAIVDSILSVLLFVFLGWVIVALFPAVKLENFSSINLSSAFLPYGVLIFALSGSAAIPDVVSLLNKDAKKIGLAVIIGTLIPAIVYFLFAFSVVGALGSHASEEAVSSLRGVLGREFVVILGLVGFLAVYDSYIILSSNARAMLELDFLFPKRVAWILVSAIPFTLYLAGLHSFILIIGAVGAVAGGIEISLIVAIYHQVRNAAGKTSSLSYIWKAAVLLLVASGVVYEALKVF